MTAAARIPATSMSFFGNEILSILFKGHKGRKWGELDKCFQVPHQNVQGILEMLVVGDHHIAVVFEGFDHGFVHWHDMMLVAIEHIIHIISSLYLIALDTPPQFDMVL